jgi:hypothetical protein
MPLNEAPVVPAQTLPPPGSPLRGGQVPAPLSWPAAPSSPPSASPASAAEATKP